MHIITYEYSDIFRGRYMLRMVHDNLDGADKRYKFLSAPSIDILVYGLHDYNNKILFPEDATFV